ncbi:linoleoyl-CoA desaturase activity protein [Podila minutissima]|nr:linoleoyl-CoA desaturase activity protein [Podila minutissima]
MSPPNVVDTQVRQRVVGDDETKSKALFERNYISMYHQRDQRRYPCPSLCPKHRQVHHVLLKDVATITSLVYCATFINTLPSLAPRLSAWVTYSIVQGTVMVSPFVLAHKCGHGAFSDNRTINTVIGWVIDSAYLVPYHTFQIAHSKHHKGTSSMTKDVDYVPLTRSKRSPPAMTLNRDAGSHDHHDHHHGSIFADTPLYNLSSFVSFLHGLALYVKWVITHFLPVPPQYESHQRQSMFYSNCGVALMVTTLLFLYAAYGARTMFMLYVAPYLVLNIWLVCITYLQHTDPKVPHFRDQAWTFQCGAASSVDRSFGVVVNHLHHHATHQCHHMFTQMPFYNAVEATKYLKEKLGKYYIYDETPIVQALIRNWRECKFVEDEGDIVAYKS